MPAPFKELVPRAVTDAHAGTIAIPLREYQLEGNLGRVVGLLTEMDGVADVESAAEDPGEKQTPPCNLMVRMQGQKVELQHLDPHEAWSGEQARLRLCVTLVPDGEHTKAELSVHQPCFMDAMVRGDIVPEAVGWCAALAISAFQGLLSASLEAALVSFGISALGLLGVRIGTAYSVWKRARRCLRSDLSRLLQRVHQQLAPATKRSGARY